MLKIYKFDPTSVDYRKVVNDSTLKGKARNKAIDETVQKIGTEVTFQEYFSDYNRNYSFFKKGYCYHCFGEAENLFEKLAYSEIEYDGDLGYWNKKENSPEDLIESRTSWDEMKDYADGMYYFIESLKGDFASGKIIIKQV